MDGFPLLPVDYCRRRGSYYGSKTELRALFAGVDNNFVYIDMDVYKNDDGPSYLLDCFVRRPDNTGWSLWNLDMPAAPPYGVWNPITQPCDWHYAYGRTYVGFFTFPEYDAYVSGYSW